MDEYLLMPTGENIASFSGTVLFIEPAVLVWEKLQDPVSREDLLRALMAEYEVEEAVVSADLDALLAQMRENDLLLED
jgi:hypothetical protein